MRAFCLKTNFQMAALSVLALGALTSCGMAKDPGLNLGISVSPDQPVIVPGRGISCVAQASAKTGDTVPTADVTGDRLPFNRFKLQWRSPDALTIAAIRVTIFSSGIDGADTTTGLEFTLSEEETAALLGLQGLTIGYASPYLGPDGQPVSRTIEVDSTSTALKSSTSPYAPCGLQIGGLTSKVGLRTYSARVRIEVTGFSTSCEEKNLDGTCLSGTQLPVRQTLNLSAQKY